MTSDQGEITRLLQRWSDGDNRAFDELSARLYPELRQLAAQHYRRERPGVTLQPTALIHEAYLRLFGQKGVGWKSRRQFFKLASGVMRHVLVDYFRSAKAQKRGGGQLHVTLDDQLGPDNERAVDVERLEGALAALKEINPLHSQIVELRFFGGLTVDDVAEVLGLNRARVKREWSAAKAWLYDEVTLP